MEKELTFKIGGEAGQGLVTIGEILAKLFAWGGWYVFTSQDYESRIRGGHNIFQIRISQNPITAMSDRVDILIALNKETIDLHLAELHTKSIVVYDGEKMKALSRAKGKFISIPMNRLATESGGQILANIVAVAAVLGILGYELKFLEQYLGNFFRKKGERVIEQNLQAAQKGYEEGVRVCEEKSGCFFHIQPLSSRGKMLITVNEAIALGALAAGCKFYTAYPMTPSTGIHTYMASKADQFGIVVEQAEDEIAAINMAIGASFAGVRAMTGTSGGGFSLMVEGLSLAAMTETPVVIFLGQRPGPATGLPTRTEQAELKFSIFAGHGEFPRLILAPGNPEDAFYLTAHAFNMAEKFQIPVIILSDQYLADCYFTLDKALDPSRISIDRHLLSSEELRQMDREYKRHAFTEEGISPRAFPGQSFQLVMTDSDEHDEYGHIIEDKDTRSKQVEKRIKKWKIMRHDILSPSFYGHLRARNLLICWGSTWGIVIETMNKLQDKGKDLAMLHFRQLWPFPVKQVMDALKNRDRLFCIENNATGQLADLIRSKTGILIDRKICQANGRPFSVQYLTESIQEEVLS